MYLYDVEVKKVSSFMVCIQADSEGQAISGLKRMLKAGDICFDLEDDHEVQFFVRNRKKAPVAQWGLM